jgi:CopG family nickel-responsive transcriptional regulator
MQSGVSRFSVSVDPQLLTEFDEIIRGIGYTRSSAIQVAMRDFLTNYKWSEANEKNTAGAVTMIYDHDYIDVITSSTHVHLDHDNCLEILAVKGNTNRIHKLIQCLRVVKGVKQLKFSILNIA